MGLTYHENHIQVVLESDAGDVRIVPPNMHGTDGACPQYRVDHGECVNVVINEVIATHDLSQVNLSQIREVFTQLQNIWNKTQTT